MPLEQLKNLGERLLRAGVAPRHVRRYLRELEDHYEDVLREELQPGVTADAAARRALERLGGEDALAASMLAQPALRSAASRFPKFIFGAVPLVVWLGTFVLALVTAQALGAAFEQLPQSGWWVRAVYVLCVAYVRVVPVAIGGAMIVVAIRQRTPMRWPVIGLTLLSVVSGSIRITLIEASRAELGDQLGIGSALLPFIWPTDLMGRRDVQALSEGMICALVMVAAGLLPYVLCRSRERVIS